MTKNIGHIETSDKSIIFRYGKKPTQVEQMPDDLYCSYHIPPVRKIQCGRYYFCPICRGNVKLPSGKPITRRKE